LFWSKSVDLDQSLVELYRSALAFAQRKDSAKV